MRTLECGSSSVEVWPDTRMSKINVLPKAKGVADHFMSRLLLNEFAHFRLGDRSEQISKIKRVVPTLWIHGPPSVQ